MDDGVISAAEAGRNFDRLLEQVEAGHSLTITRDGRPVAVVNPVDAIPEDERNALRRQMLSMMATGIDVGYQGPLDREALHRR